MPEKITDLEIRQFLELQGKINEELNRSLSSLVPRRLSSLSQEKLIEEVVRAKNGLYQVVEFSMTTAQTTPKPLSKEGGVVSVEFYNSDGSRNLTASIDLRFNSNQNDPVTFGFGDNLVHPFHNLYAAWSAQSGVTCKLLIGYEYDNIFRLQRNTNANISTVSTVNAVTLISAINRLTQVPGAGTIVNARGFVGLAAGEAAIYTVTAAKTLYIRSASLQFDFSTASLYSELAIHSAAGAYEKTIMFGPTASNNLGVHTSTIQNFLPAITVEAGKKIYIRKRTTADAAGTDGAAFAHIDGWEE